jgi:hypothetical protein
MLSFIWFPALSATSPNFPLGEAPLLLFSDLDLELLDLLLELSERFLSLLSLSLRFLSLETDLEPDLLLDLLLEPDRLLDLLLLFLEYLQSFSKCPL